MTRLAPGAWSISIARPGDDELAPLFDAEVPVVHIAAELAVARRAVALPDTAGRTPVSVTLSLALAYPPEDSGDIAHLLEIADRRLCADKVAARLRGTVRALIRGRPAA